MLIDFLRLNYTSVPVINPFWPWSCFFIFFISRFSLLMFSLVSLQPYLKMTDSFPFCCILFNFVSE